MSQTVISLTVPAGHSVIFFEKPQVSTRIFFGIRALADDTKWAQSKISLGDPLFTFCYVIDGPGKYFEARGEGIFQGDVWVWNASTVNLLYVGTEILI